MTFEIILLVGDTPDIFQLKRLYLEGEGFQVQTVGNGLQTLGEEDLLNPALAVLDIFRV